MYCKEHRNKALIVKCFSLLVSLTLLFSLVSCMKSEEVKNVEKLIEDIGEVTIESRVAIMTAECAYDGLSEEDAKKVNNYADLVEAKQQYDEIIEENLSAIQSYYDAASSALASRDIETAESNIEEAYTLYNNAGMKQSGRLNELSFSFTELDYLRSCINDPYYHQAPIMRLGLVVDTTNMTYNADYHSDIAMGATNYNYNFNSFDSAYSAYLDYKEYLSEETDLSLTINSNTTGVVLAGTYSGGEINIVLIDSDSGTGILTIMLYDR